MLDGRDFGAVAELWLQQFVLYILPSILVNNDKFGKD